MNTTNYDGTPYSLDDLLSSFWLRVETLKQFAGIIQDEDNVCAAAKTLATAVHLLADDWSCFDKAVQQWDERENGTEYLNTTTKGAKP